MLDITRPALTGSARQVEWATGLRDMWRVMYLADVTRRGNPDGELAAVQTMVNGHTSARWWIDNRADLPAAVIRASRVAVGAGR